MATVSNVLNQLQASQPRAMRRLAAALERPSHAYLFAGQAKTGKRTAARLFAQALLCPDGGCGLCQACEAVAAYRHPDYRVWDVPEGEKTFKVEQVRELITQVGRRPFQGSRSVHVLAAMDQLAPAGANALLKTLEEPPPTAVLLLLTRDMEALLPTILSRCQIVPFGPVPVALAPGQILLPEGPGLAAIAWADKLAAMPAADQQQALEVLVAWLRDVAWQAAGGDPARLLLPGEAARTGAIAGTRTPEAWVALAEEAEATRDRLERHVNAKLALDRLARAWSTSV